MEVPRELTQGQSVKGGNGGILGAYVIGPAIGLVKTYGLLVLVVLLVSGGAAAAAVASTVAVAGGTTIGIVAAEVGPFAHSIVTGKGLVQGGDSSKPAAKPSAKSTAKAKN